MKQSLGAKTIAYPTPVFIVGSYDKEGQPNVMNAAWGCISSSQPPCISVSIRKVTYTYENILARKAFTVNIPSQSFIREADYYGLASGRNEDKFAKTGLTPVRSELVDAPYIKEFPLTIECKVINVVEIGIHTQFIGEILDVKVNQDALDEKGHINLQALAPMVFAPAVGRYYALGPELGKAFSIGREI